MNNICVFTTGNDLTLLDASCARVGIKLHSYPARWIGFVTTKVREGVKLLETRNEPFAMWLDGHDSLVLKPEDEILTRLESLGGKVIIGAEHNCWPDAHVAPQWPECGGLPRFPQAGGFIGPTPLVISAMHTVIQTAGTDEDDTRAWVTSMLSGALPHVIIDHGRRIFCAEYDGDTSLDDPCVRHWNGRVQGRDEFWNTLKTVPFTPNR